MTVHITTRDRRDVGVKTADAGFAVLRLNSLQRIRGFNFRSGKAVMLQRFSRTFLYLVLMTTAARVDVTPPPDIFPYADRVQKPPFIDVHDPVFARALVLDDGKTQVAIVVIDCTTIPKPKVFNHDLAQELGIPESNLLLAASHTHSSLMVYYEGDLPAYAGEADAAQAREIERIRQGAVGAVRQAKAQLRPARLAFGRGEAYLNVGNGGVTEPGDPHHMAALGDPHAPSDKSLDVLRIQGLHGTPIALLLDYAVPSTVMLHAPSRDGDAEVSGDLFGMTAQLIEKASSNSPVVLFATGADGDQKPILRWARSRVGSVPQVNEGQAAWAILDVMAGYLANAALAVTDTMPEGTGDVKISAAAKTVICPGQKVRVDAKSGAATITDLPPIPIPLNVIRINDIVLAGVGGNVATPIGEKIKAVSPYPKTTLIGDTSGTVGYILTDAAYAHPGHGLAGSPLKSGCAEAAILQGLQEMMRTKP